MTNLALLLKQMSANEDSSADVEQQLMLSSSGSAPRAKTPQLIWPLTPQLTAAELDEIEDDGKTLEK